MTTGATEAIAAALLALCEPGDEVVTFEPYYDSYAACIALAGAERRTVVLRPPDYARRPGRARRRVLRPHPGGAVQLAAQPDRQGVRARRAGADRRALPRARRPRDHRRGLRAPRVRRARARPALDAARDGRAHADDLLRGQDVLVHRLEDRLGDGPARAGRRRADRQAVPHLRLRRAVPARDRPRPGARGRLLRILPRRAAGQARPALRRPGGSRTGGLPPRGHVLRDRPTSGRSARPTATRSASRCPSARASSPCRPSCSTTTRRSAGRSSASRSASATR